MYARVHAIVIVFIVFVLKVLIVAISMVLPIAVLFVASHERLASYWLLCFFVGV